MARRFQAQEKTVQRELLGTLKKMDATGLKITQDYDSGECAIQFDRKGRRYVFRNATWAYPSDNLRASQLTIKLLYQALEAYGTTSQDTAIHKDPFEQFFSGFQALPDDSLLMLGDGSQSWWDTLGLEKTASREAVVNAFRALARIHHPDVGGSAEEFRRLRQAYEKGIGAT